MSLVIGLHFPFTLFKLVFGVGYGSSQSSDHPQKEKNALTLHRVVYSMWIRVPPSHEYTGLRAPRAKILLPYYVSLPRII